MNIIKYNLLHPALEDYVDSIIYMCNDVYENQIFHHTVLPNHQYYLSFEWDTDFMVRKSKDHDFTPFYHSTIIPPQFFKTEIKGKKIKSVIIKFKNGGFYRLFKMPIPIFKNKCCNALDVFDSKFSNIYEQIMNFDCPNMKFKVIEDFLLNQIHSCKPYTAINLAIDTLALKQGNISILNLASIACLSVRQVQRNIMDQIGLTPRVKP
jgi:hypothetical protein